MIPSGADISPCGQYRYMLWRAWDESKPWCVWVMLNPSTADAHKDDPTIRRCVGFAKDWGFGGIEVVNLFAYRATDPRSLRLVDDPIGKHNDDNLRGADWRAKRVVLAWGKLRRPLWPRANDVLGMIQTNPCCLKLTRDGHPWHPLYVKRSQEPRLFVTNPYDTGSPS